MRTLCSSLCNFLCNIFSNQITCSFHCFFLFSSFEAVLGHLLPTFCGVKKLLFILTTHVFCKGLKFIASDIDSISGFNSISHYLPLSVIKKSQIYSIFNLQEHEFLIRKPHHTSMYDKCFELNEVFLGRYDFLVKHLAAGRTTYLKQTQTIPLIHGDVDY